MAIRWLPGLVASGEDCSGEGYPNQHAPGSSKEGQLLTCKLDP